MQISTYLKSSGYLEIPLKKTLLGQIEVRAKVNGEDALLLVDTGASGTVFDEASAARLKLEARDAEAVAAGLGVTSQSAAFCEVGELVLGALTLKNITTRIVDMSHVNTALRQRGAQSCDGVLGADVLVGRAAVIDYRDFKLYLKEE
ncbi:MAG TPA: retropepsin-like aspartic protease [Pyrinomonadaceae bacterium]|jgi:predicted aspartyl protease|nr:retropepsin-like aspartic protease [Pyrinomonadaceae bacterium]